MAQRSVLALALALCAGAFAALAGSAGQAPAAAQATGIKVRVIGQGTPVEHVVVRVRPDDGSTPENWPAGVQPLAEDSTKADGTVSFPDVKPGRYIVVAPCNRLPGDWIGGTSATRLEVMPERATSTTLTLRRGGHIIGKAAGLPEMLAKAAVRSDTPNSLISGCPMLSPSPIAPDGSFEVSKVPIGSKSYVRIEFPLGDGTLAVSEEFELEKAEIVTRSWTLPSLAPADLGTARVVVRDPSGKPVNKGSVELSLRQASPSWRYVVTYPIGETDTVTVAKSLPPGRYFIRAYPDPGANPYWMATPESLTIEAGKTAALRMKSRLREGS